MYKLYYSLSSGTEPLNVLSLTTVCLFGNISSGHRNLISLVDVAESAR